MEQKKKNFLLIIGFVLVMFLVFILSQIRAEQEKQLITEFNIQTAQPLQTPLPEQTEQLYRTNTGKCYHKENCVYLISKIPVTLSEAKNIGLRPCSICISPEE